MAFWATSASPLAGAGVAARAGAAGASAIGAGGATSVTVSVPGGEAWSAAVAAGGLAVAGSTGAEAGAGVTTPTSVVGAAGVAAGGRRSLFLLDVSMATGVTGVEAVAELPDVNDFMRSASLSRLAQPSAATPPRTARMRTVRRIAGRRDFRAVAARS